MKYNIQNISDITYEPELIPHHFRFSYGYIESGGGFNSQTALRPTTYIVLLRKSSAH